MIFRIQSFKSLLAPAALVGLVLIAYAPAFSGQWIWDDDAYISANMLLRTPGGLERIWLHRTDSPQYYPLTFTSFWVEQHLFGPSPGSYHWDNIILHACSAVLVWMILGRLGVPGAWLIAAIWAVHPVNVESVAWAAERKNILSGVFYLLALLSFLPFILPGERGRGGRYFLTLLFLLLALLCKTVTSTFAGAVLLLIWWKKRKIRYRDVCLVIPLVMLALPFSWNTSYLERNHVGARGLEFGFTVLQRCEIAAHAVWFYAGKDVLPINLSFIYARWPLNDLQLWYIGAIFAALGLLWMVSRRMGRGALVGPLYFVGTLAPALGFVNVYPMRYSFVADHFQYLASIGVIGAVVLALSRCGRWMYGPLGRIGLCALLATLLVLTYERCQVFHDQMTIWNDALAKNPDSWMVRTNLGVTLLGLGQDELKRHRTEIAAQDFSAAQLQLERAIQLRSDIAEPWLNLAHLEDLERHYDLAERYLHNAMMVNPLNAEVYFQMGAVMVQAGKIDQGIAEYVRAIALDKRHVPAIVNLGVALGMEGKTRDAADMYRYALTIVPDSVQAHVNLGNALMKMGDYGKAAQQYREVLAIEPNFPEAAEGLRAALNQKN